MAKQTTYDYDVEIKYVNGNKQIEIDKKCIKMIMIDYDYQVKNAPALYLTINLEISLYNNMVLHSKTGGKLYLNIKTYKSGSTNSIKKNYIKEQFSYFFKDDTIATSQDLVEASDSDGTSYKKAILGLIKSELVDNNKRIMNNIFKNTNTSSILHFYTHHMKMIIEPFDNNPTHDLFIVPPIEGISKLIKFLNESATFYTTTYRYFMDFNKTYLLSTKGKAVDIKDGTYNTIKIDVISDVGSKTSDRGIYKDTKNKIYVIEIDSSDFHIGKNKVTEKKFNKLYGVDSMGNREYKELKINKEKGTSTKTRMVRIYNENLNYINSLADEIETSANTITVVKGELDGSLIVPYKEYRISNIKQYKDLDGKYLLVAKKEVIIQQEGDFSCSTSMTFKRVS